MNFTTEELREISSALFLAAHFREGTSKDASRSDRDRAQAALDVDVWHGIRAKILDAIGPQRGRRRAGRQSFDERMAAYRKNSHPRTASRTT